MATADDELLAAVNGLEGAGVAVNATKPVKPIRSTKKKKVETPKENPTDGMVSFVEEEGPFKNIPGIMEVSQEDIEEALDACGVGYTPECDEPNVAGPGIPLPPNCGATDGSLIMKIRQFALETRSIWIEQKGTQAEKHYGTKALWNYIIALNFCRVRVDKIYHEIHGSADMKFIYDVFCHATLIDQMTGEELTQTVMTASTDESWLKDKANALSSAYGLAQTRAEERLARTVFGYQAALAGLDPTPAEELDVKWGAKKEQEL